MDKIVYTNGLAVILIWESSQHSEYTTLTSSQTVYMLFETEDAVHRVSEILNDEYFDVQEALELVGTGRGLKYTLVSNYIQYKLQNAFNYPIGVTRDGFAFTDSNIHLGQHINITLEPPKFEVDAELLDKNIGTTADGEPLSRVIERFKENLENGYYIYYPKTALKRVQYGDYDY